MFRVVIYAEGPGELAGRKRYDRAPGSPITEMELGAAHLLVRRCLDRCRNLSPESIIFEEPLRTPRGPRARGSMLLDEGTLRPLLTWPQSTRPHLAVVLVDADGKKDRQQELDSFVEGLSTQVAIGVAIQEFEAWLIADAEALKAVLRKPLSSPRPPERLGRREAKELLQQWCEEHGRGRDVLELRRMLAEQCNLDTLAQQCGAFNEFLERLRAGR